MATETDYSDDAFDDPDMLLAALIADVEKDKGEARKTFDNLKEVYHAGRYRSAGFTKRWTEDEMNRITGRIMGYEFALSTLYDAVNMRAEKGGA